MGLHDALFKRMFEDPARAAGEIAALLPRGILPAVDLGSLVHVPGSFVDDELVDRHADLLFRGSLVDGETVYVYFLFEHQSEPHPRMPWRLLKYEVRIWDKHEREHPGEPLPLIIPLVVHHGEQGWTAARELHELVSGTVSFPEARRFVPSFDFLIDDLVRCSDEDIAARSLDDGARVALWLLRDGRSVDRFLEHLDAWLALLATLLEPGASSADGPTFLRYIYEVLGEPQLETVKDRLVLHNIQAEQAMESAADVLRRKGREEGREEGKRDTLLRLLELKFGPLDERVSNRLERATAEELDTFLERFVSATHPGDVTR